MGSENLLQARYKLTAIVLRSAHRTFETQIQLSPKLYGFVRKGIRN